MVSETENTTARFALFGKQFVLNKDLDSDSSLTLRIERLYESVDAKYKPREFDIALMKKYFRLSYEELESLIADR